jgi:hypothetical protein
VEADIAQLDGARLHALLAEPKTPGTPIEKRSPATCQDIPKCPVRKCDTHEITPESLRSPHPPTSTMLAP